MRASRSLLTRKREAVEALILELVEERAATGGARVTRTMESVELSPSRVS